MGQLKPVDQSCDECDRVVLLNTNTHIKVSKKEAILNYGVDWAGLNICGKDSCDKG